MHEHKGNNGSRRERERRRPLDHAATRGIRCEVKQGGDGRSCRFTTRSGSGRGSVSIEGCPWELLIAGRHKVWRWAYERGCLAGGPWFVVVFGRSFHSSPFCQAAEVVCFPRSGLSLADKPVLPTEPRLSPPLTQRRDNASAPLFPRSCLCTRPGYSD